MANPPPTPFHSLHVEHYADGDLVNEGNPTLKYPFGRDTLLQSGPSFPGL